MRQRRIAWPVCLVLAAGGVALAALEPGDVSYLISTTAVIPLIAVAVIVFEDPWRRARRRTRTVVWIVSAVMAAAGAASNIVFPGARSFIIGGLMVAPLMVLLGSIMGRDADSEDTPLHDVGAGDILGPPL
jgi:hypothetical protein